MIVADSIVVVVANTKNRTTKPAAAHSHIVRNTNII